VLRIIAGLDLPDGGTLKIGGRDAAGIPAHKRHVNTVFQSYALFPHMTVRDNVAFGLLFSWGRHTVQGMSTKAQVILGEIRALPPEELQAVCSEIRPRSWPGARAGSR
jgi:spermidine/putrescine transport system ATP-binding protein